MMRCQLELHRPAKRAGGTDFHLSVEAEIAAGEILAITGPSGSGKTTFLRILAGLEKPTAGRITLDGKVLYDSQSSRAIPPQQRNIGKVFQDYALFPHLSVRRQLDFAAAGKIEKKEIEALITAFHLKQQADQRPAELSGGQQQRLALARSLVQRPRLLLLDEPLAALDPSIRTELQDYLLELPERSEMMIILVSHQPTEIIRLADRMLRLEAGSLVQSGRPTELLLANSLATIEKIDSIDEQHYLVLSINGGYFRVAVDPATAKQLEGKQFVDLGKIAAWK